MRTILVVDDEFGILDILEAMLADAGFRVLLAANGRQALGLLQPDLPGMVMPDLLLVDYMMPMLDGPALVQAIRADSRMASLPVIMMSGAPESALRRRFEGFQGFIKKPFQMTTVMAAIGRVLDGPADPED